MLVTCPCAAHQLKMLAHMHSHILSGYGIISKEMEMGVYRPRHRGGAGRPVRPARAAAAPLWARQLHHQPGCPRPQAVTRAQRGPPPAQALLPVPCSHKGFFFKLCLRTRRA